MNETNSSLSDTLCVVCGKDTGSGRGFMTLHVDGRPVPLCCPMCYKIYDVDPARYVARQRVREIVDNQNRP